MNILCPKTEPASDHRPFVPILPHRRRKKNYSDYSSTQNVNNYLVNYYLTH